MLGQAIALSLFFFLAPLAWKAYSKEGKPWTKFLGLESKDPSRDLFYAVTGFALLAATAFLVVAVSALAGFDDTQKVAETILKLSAAELAFIVTVQVLGEEVFFRAFLSPRIGAIASSVAFALAHSAYGSTVEVAAALLSGLILAFVYKQAGNVWPGFAAHAGFNLLSLAAYLNSA